MGHYCVRQKIRKRKRKIIASKEHSSYVKNCIKTSSSVKLESIKMFGHHIMCNTSVTKDGNGKWSGEFIKEYRKIKDARIAYLKSHYSGKYAACDKDGVGIPQHGFRKRKQPWYMLTNGKCYNYEERKVGDTTVTKPWRVESEANHFNGKYTPKKMKFAEKMERYTQEKLKKWEKRNPCPVSNDDKEKDLFESQIVPEWKYKRDCALEQIRDFVVSMFDKLQLSGRYKVNDNTYTEKKITELKDVDGDGHKINELDENSKLLKKAKKETNKEKRRNPKLVCSNLKDHKKKRGRVILPDAA